jgi:hypothetical protein
MEKLILIQSELKAPKAQFNKFGNYAYRNAEDILEALKPLLKKYNCLLTISDWVQHIGENRIYVQATATFTDDEGKTIEVTALARESESKKGMDEAQITGAASSYARKYALNGLFLIDDTKDADFINTHGKEEITPKGKPQLLPETEAWDKAVKYLAETEDASIQEIEKKYTIPNRQRLIDEALDMKGNVGMKRLGDDINMQA